MQVLMHIHDHESLTIYNEKKIVDPIGSVGQSLKNNQPMVVSKTSKVDRGILDGKDITNIVY